MSSLTDGDFAVIAVTHDSTITDALNWKRLCLGVQ